MEKKQKNQSKPPLLINSLFFLMFFILGYVMCALENMSVLVKIIIVFCVAYLSPRLIGWIFREYFTE